MLNKRAIAYVKEFLVNNFSALKYLKPLIKQMEPIHPTSKYEVVPMKILFKDEKRTHDTIDILTQLTTDAKLNQFIS